MSAAGRPARQRRPLLMWSLVAAFILTPIIEVWLLVTVGGWIGLWPTIGLLIISAALGAWLTRREGSRAWSALVEAMQGGKLPTGRLADAALVLVGGILLMVPGFFSDVVGLVFLLPATRPLVRRVIGFIVARHTAVTKPATTVIRGEVIEVGIEDGRGGSR